MNLIRDDRGSLIVAAIFFMLIFLSVAGIGIDLSEYFMKSSELQMIADKAALTGGRALDQPKNRPELTIAYEAIYDHLIQHQGTDHVKKVYDIDSRPNKYIKITQFQKQGGASGTGTGINFTQNSGELRFMTENGANVESMNPTGVEALGSAKADFDGDGSTDLPYFTSETTLKLLDNSDQSPRTINLPTSKKADLDKTLIGVGSFTGNDPWIYYTGKGHSNIYKVKPGKSPVLIASPDNGVNAVAGFGDLDGDGQNELAFADGSQDPRYIEKSDPVNNGPSPMGHFRRMNKGNVGTPGSNNGIGYGAPADFNNDGQAELPVVGGGNGPAFLYPSQSETYLGSNPSSGCNCAEKSPIAITDIDGDQSGEVVYQNKQNDELRYFDDDGITRKTVLNDGGNVVTADNTRGVVPGIHKSSSQDVYYRVGVTVFGQFEPYFLPKAIFGNSSNLIEQIAVARVEPKGIKDLKGKKIPVDCGMFANGTIQLSGNNINTDYPDLAEKTGVCGNSNIDGSNSPNGIVGDAYTLETSTIEFPGGGGGEKNKFSNPRSMPSFTKTDPADYDVELTATNFANWSSCSSVTWFDSIREGYWIARGDESLINKNLIPSGISSVYQTFFNQNIFYFPSQKSLGIEAISSYFRMVPLPMGQGVGTNVNSGNSGNGGGSTYVAEKALRGPSGDPLEWEDGTPVCVAETATGEYEFTNKGSDDNNTHSNQIMKKNGDPVTIYADKSVNFQQGTGLKGGLYSEMNINSEGNSHDYMGNTDKLGGLALWAEGNINLEFNNLTMDGIVGADGMVNYQGPPVGGGKGTTNHTLRGITISRTGGMNWPANSSSQGFYKDESKFDYDVLDVNGWVVNKTDDVDVPLFSNVNVYLVE